MKSAIDKLLYTNVSEFIDQLQTLNDQDKTISEEVRLTIKILIALGKKATEDQLELLQEVKENLKIHRVLLRDIACLFDYPPYPQLDIFARQLNKNSLQFQSYLDAYDKDPKEGRVTKLNKRGRAAKSTEQIFEEQFDISALHRVIANIQNLVDSSYLSPDKQHNLAQQVVYINAVGKEFLLHIKNRDFTNLTNLTRLELRELSDLLIGFVNDPLLGTQARIKAQLNLLAVMREEYFRCTGVFLNTTQIVSVLLSLNNLQHNSYVELAPDEDQKGIKAILAAFQWIFVQGDKGRSEANADLLVKDIKSKEVKDFFAFLGVSSKDLDVSLTEETSLVGVIKPEMVGLGKKVEMEFAYRVPSHKTDNQFTDKSSAHSTEYLQKISIALNMAKSEQPILLIAKNVDEAQELNKELSKYLKNQGKTFDMNVFTGVEPAEKRHQWFRENSANTRIAITVPDLANNEEFKTKESKHGCLAIQTYLSKLRETGTILDGLSGFGKASQFVAIHEENGIVSSLSGNLKSSQEKENILQAVANDKRNRQQEKAVEQYYTNSVIRVQRVVLSQFDDWRAFLHLVYPRTEWKQLDSALSLIRDDLIKKLDQNWIKILNATNSEQLYSNPYIRRHENNQLETNTLDSALQDYELIANNVWKNTLGFLKEKTESKIPENSTNALRCKYLEQVELSEQLKLDKLVTRENTKRSQYEQKKASRLVKSALDVNGALLKYSDGDVAAFKQPFIDSQIKLIAQDISKQINLSSLSASVKKELIDRVINADSLIELELVLIDYEQSWTNTVHMSEIYRMQPVIHELVRVYQQSGIELSDESQILKAIYLDNSVNEIVHNLESTLSWAKKENRGFGYLIERSAVKEAAADLLSAVEAVKLASDPVIQQSALKNLYKKLARHQAQLEGLWIFSLGHKNTRDLINQTLNTLNEITVIGSGKDELNLDFINECKEEAHSDVVKQKFRVALKELEERNSPWLKESKDWQDTIKSLRVIQGENPSLYAIEEMHHFISMKCKELSQTKSRIVDPLIHLRGILRSLWSDVSHKHQELLSESSHFDRKKEQIKNDLDGIKGYEAKEVELIVVNNGSREYYDLLIKGTGSLPLLDGFTRYNSQILAMRNDREQLIKKCDVPNSQHALFDKLCTEQLPLLKAGQGSQVDLKQFPESYRENVRTIIALQEFVAGKTPEHLDEYPEHIRNHFHDRAIVQSLNVDKFLNKHLEGSSEIQQMFDSISTIKDPGLKSEFIELYNRIHPPKVEEVAKPWWSPTRWISGLASMIPNPFRLEESEDDWRYQFHGLATSPNGHIVEFLSPNINKRLVSLTSELVGIKDNEAQKIDSLKEQIKFMDGQIADEEKKGGVIIRRFNSISDLYDFETALRQFKVENAQAPVKEDKAEHKAADEDEFFADEFLESDNEESPDSEEDKPGLNPY